MSTIHRTLRRTSLPILLVLCLAALSVSYAFADEALRPLATQVIGDPDAAVTGKLAVGTATPGNKALTVVGVIDFLGAGTTHNYFTQGAGNNLQINTNVDEANTVGDPTKSQWKLVMGSSLDWFSIRRSPAGATYNEDALFFIEGSTGNVGIMTVDTGNGATIPITPQARLHVQTSTDSYATYSEQIAGSGTSYGVVGLSDSTDGGTGVFGGNYVPSGTTKGVWGLVGSPTGTGVAGNATSTTGLNYGVYGATGSGGGYGVYGFAPGTGIAMFGDNTNPLGWAGYFSGDVGVNNNLYVTGSIYKSADYFRIDHPLDPTKYLNHSVVESPDMKNIYDGVATLDDSGQAWVQLPDWFEALNQDFRYQLTPIGEFAPLYVSQEIQDNRFQIAGGVAGMEVSWQVTGIRHDAYAEAHRIQVEEDKPASGMAGASSKLDPETPDRPSPEPVPPQTH